LAEIEDTESRPFSGSKPGRAAMFLPAAAVQDRPEFTFEPALQTVWGQVTVRFVLSEAQLP